MKFVLLFLLTVCVVYLAVGETDDDKVVVDTPEKRTDKQADGVFSAENDAKDFLKDKRDPSSRKYYKYGSRILRMAGHRRHRYGSYGGHRYRYGHHGGSSSSSEEEEGGYFGNRYGGGRYGSQYGRGGYDWDD